MTETETSSGWLSREQLREARERLPILYVEVVPVRVDERGVVTTIGLLLRATSEGASTVSWCRGGCSTTSGSGTR
jgi:hypothetical protein